MYSIRYFREGGGAIFRLGVLTSTYRNALERGKSVSVRRSVLARQRRKREKGKKSLESGPFRRHRVLQEKGQLRAILFAHFRIEKKNGEKGVSSQSSEENQGVPVCRSWGAAIL